MRIDLTFFVVSLVLSLAITPAIRRFALAAGAVDHPGGRKTHARSTPLLGGLAIFLSFFTALALIGFMDRYSHAEFQVPYSWKGFLLGGLLILGLGIWDDFKRLGAGTKFLVQSVAALSAIGLGYRITTLQLPLIEHLDLGWVSFPFTFLWITGITNAFNLLDGLDGLSSGVAFMSLVSFFLIAVATHNDGASFLILALAGSTLGFLRYNFHPASIFLGDSGSLFLGFMLSLLSIHVSQEGVTPVSLLMPMMVMGLPVVDTVFSMLRRFLKAMQAIHEKKLGGFLFSSKSMFQADRDHIHHRLLRLGFSHRKAVFLLYSISAVLGLGAYFSVAIPAMYTGLPVFAFVFAAVLGLHKLGYGFISDRSRTAAREAPTTNQEGRRALIYGADLEGSVALREIRRRAELGLTPVGFLDDNAAMSNRLFHGLPVFSNGRGLERAVKKYQVTDIIISGEIVDAAKIEELRKFCSENPAICLRRFRVSFGVVSLDSNSLPLLTPPSPRHPPAAGAHLRRASPSLSGDNQRAKEAMGGDG